MSTKISHSKAVMISRVCVAFQAIISGVAKRSVFLVVFFVWLFVLKQKPLHCFFLAVGMVDGKPLNEIHTLPEDLTTA